MRYLLLLLLMLGAGAQAGPCVPDSSGNSVLVRSFDRILDPTQNVVGKVLPDLIPIDHGGTFSITCTCEGGSAPLYFQSRSSLSTPQYEEGGLTYYYANPFLAIGTRLTVMPHGNLPVPFDEVTDNVPIPCGSDGKAHIDNVPVGYTGTISFYLEHAFVGVHYFDMIILAQVYGRWGTQGSYGVASLSRVLLTGIVTVPLSCEINDGQVITVDFGSLRASDISSRGVKPARFEPNLITLNYVCSDVSESMTVELALVGEESADLPGVLQTTNPDIGIQILDSARNPLAINSGRVPLRLQQYKTGAEPGQATLYAYPVNTTGTTPAPGGFSASAIMRIDFQ
ncbi:fimbrial protein [Nissabacter sp. SGAir0207]|uniref:fimbrial protein n=1 Tax=Nissabacter sp. SGAir0207 TaxID=2126321 RepID=UPI00143E0E6A|nr:fimbrial protein [Nissabacter sp. SGAir0207]